MTTILIADDAAFMRLRTVQLLADAGYETVEARDGRDAIARYLSERPDAVLMDVTMPEIDGVEALEQIRREDPKARVAMVSAIGQETTVVRALRLGALDYIVKPYRPERVLATVKRLLG